MVSSITLHRDCLSFQAAEGCSLILLVLPSFRTTFLVWVNA